MKKEFTELFAIPQVKWSLLVLAGLIVALLIFHAGVAVGERRGMHIFVARSGIVGAPYGLPHAFMEGGHGVVGMISKIALPTTTITARDGASEVVTITSETQIRDEAQVLTPADLKEGEQVIVVGEPEDSDETNHAIDALLVRVLSSAATTSASTSSPQTHGILIIHMPMMQ